MKSILFVIALIFAGFACSIPAKQQETHQGQAIEVPPGKSNEVSSSLIEKEEVLSYKILREYKGNNDYHINFTYLETPFKVDTSRIDALIELYNVEHPNSFKNKGFLLYYNDLYYATILEVARGRTSNFDIKINEYIYDQASFEAKRDSMLNIPFSRGSLYRDRDSVICHCEYFFNPYVKGKLIYKNRNSGQFHAGNSTVNLDTTIYHQQFEKYGDRNKEVYTFYWSNPYKDDPYYTLHYINDFGDMLVKDHRHEGILSLCRKWTY